jgi:hypothetical protein
MRRLAFFVAIGCITFLAVFVIRVHRQQADSVAPSRPGADAPDSVQLSAMGIRPGAQLVAFVFGGSRCGFCQKQETKRAVTSLREALHARYVRPGVVQSVSVVGIAVNTDLREGLQYLTSMGPNAFTEISVGSGWQNEHIVRLIRREQAAEPGLPLIIVVARSMQATLAPLTMTYSNDSVLKVVQGASEIANWVRGGADLGILPPLVRVLDTLSSAKD